MSEPTAISEIVNENEKVIFKSFPHTSKYVPEEEQRFKIPNKIEFTKTAKEKFNIDFKFNEYNKEIVKQLWDYFFENESELSKDKGIMLAGGVGVGKTLIMSIFSELLRGSKQSFKMANALDIQMQAISKFTEVLDLYTFRADEYNNHNPKVYCFDDIGSENRAIKAFGNEINLFSQIIHLRYVDFSNFKIKLKTHITTNLDIETFKEFYADDRIISRMREMFNIVILKGKDNRK